MVTTSEAMPSMVGACAPRGCRGAPRAAGPEHALQPHGSAAGGVTRGVVTLELPSRGRADEGLMHAAPADAAPAGVRRADSRTVTARTAAPALPGAHGRRAL